MGFKGTLLAKGMSGIDKRCLISLDTTGKCGRICVERCQKDEMRVILRCLRDESESVNRRLRGPLVEAGKGKGSEKLCEEKEKGGKEGRRVGRVCFAK